MICSHRCGFSLPVCIALARTTIQELTECPSTGIECTQGTRLYREVGEGWTQIMVVSHTTSPGSNWPHRALEQPQKAQLKLRGNTLQG